MLIFDQLKKNDPQLRMVAIAVLCGLGVLAAGLWWVQIVSKRDYEARLEMQSYRTVRMPAVRGKILDKNGAVLAENRASYNVSLYLDELRTNFVAAVQTKVARKRAELKHAMEQEQSRLGRELKAQERKAFLLSAKEKEPLAQAARYEVVSNVVTQIGHRLGQPYVLNPTNFHRHYKGSLALPLQVVTHLTAAQLAVFSEQCSELPGADLEIQSMRFYPCGTTACHVLGSLRRDEESVAGEEAFFSYRLPDYRGWVGVEYGYDDYLHGKAGVKTMRVNNVGYRQADTVWQAADTGRNVILTIDLE